MVLHLAKNSFKNFKSRGRDKSEIEVGDTWTNGDRGGSDSDEDDWTNWLLRHTNTYTLQ